MRKPFRSPIPSRRRPVGRRVSLHESQREASERQQVTSPSREREIEREVDLAKRARERERGRLGQVYFSLSLSLQGLVTCCLSLASLWGSWRLEGSCNGYGDSITAYTGVPRS